VFKRPLLLLALPAVGLLSGCGNSRTPVPDLAQVQPPNAFRTLAYRRDGIALRAPLNWAVADQKAPLVAVISSGPAVIALWRYPAAATPPAGPGALASARRALIAAARRAQPGLRVVRSAVVEADGHGAVELDTLQRLDGQTRRLRSMHVYLPGAEVVLEEYAPPALFHRVDHAVFSPVKRSLRLTVPGAA
jgi:hypothetical protein